MLRKYGLLGCCNLLLSLLYTKLFYRQARIIRLPFDIRNSKFIKIGKGFTTGKGCRLEAFPIEGDNHVLFIGENVQINDYVHITAMKNVSIGNNVLIASKVYISDSSHGSYSGNEDDSSPYVVPQERKYNTKKVLINDNVWLGEMVTILPGVTIGSGTIVGANSVVSKDLPSNVIAVGVPAKAIKRFNDESMKWERIKN